MFCILAPHRGVALCHLCFCWFAVLSLISLFPQPQKLGWNKFFQYCVVKKMSWSHRFTCSCKTSRGHILWHPRHGLSRSQLLSPLHWLWFWFVGLWDSCHLYLGPSLYLCPCWCIDWAGSWLFLWGQPQELRDRFELGCGTERAGDHGEVILERPNRGKSAGRVFSLWLDIVEQKPSRKWEQVLGSGVIVLPTLFVYADLCCLPWPLLLFTC